MKFCLIRKDEAIQRMKQNESEQMRREELKQKENSLLVLVPKLLMQYVKFRKISSKHFVVSTWYVHNIYVKYLQKNFLF